jgi:hypothetical protein
MLATSHPAENAALVAPGRCEIDDLFGAPRTGMMQQYLRK